MVLAVISYNGKQHCCSLFWVKSVVIWLLMIDLDESVETRSGSIPDAEILLIRQGFIECHGLRYIFLYLDTDSHIFYPKPQTP